MEASTRAAETRAAETAAWKAQTAELRGELDLARRKLTTVAQQAKAAEKRRTKHTAELTKEITGLHRENGCLREANDRLKANEGDAKRLQDVVPQLEKEVETLQRDKIFWMDTNNLTVNSLNKAREDATRHFEATLELQAALDNKGVDMEAASRAHTTRIEEYARRETASERLVTTLRRRAEVGERAKDETVQEAHKLRQELLEKNESVENYKQQIDSLTPFLTSVTKLSQDLQCCHERTNEAERAFKEEAATAIKAADNAERAARAAEAADRAAEASQRGTEAIKTKFEASKKVWLRSKQDINKALDQEVARRMAVTEELDEARRLLSQLTPNIPPPGLIMRRNNALSEDRPCDNRLDVASSTRSHTAIPAATAAPAPAAPSEVGLHLRTSENYNITRQRHTEVVSSSVRVHEGASATAAATERAMDARNSRAR